MQFPRTFYVLPTGPIFTRSGGYPLDIIIRSNRFVIVPLLDAGRSDNP